MIATLLGHVGNNGVGLYLVRGKNGFMRSVLATSEGHAIDLVRVWLDSQDQQTRQQRGLPRWREAA